MKVNLAMKGLLVVVWLMLVPAAWAITPLIWDISDSTATEAQQKLKYSTLINSIRTELQDPQLSIHGIPVFKRATDPPNYLLVEIKASDSISITFSLDRNDLYTTGYSDKIMDKKIEKCRYHVFKDHDTPRGKRNGLCDGVPESRAIRSPIRYDSSYKEMEDNAGRPRRQIGLGINKLKSSVEKVYGTEMIIPREKEQQAELFLTFIQMVSEAARIKYIQRLIPKYEDGVVYPDPKALCFENRWSKVSRAIKAAPTPTEAEPLVIIVDCYTFTYTSVEELQKELALLCNKCRDDTANTLPRASQIDVPNRLLELEYGSHAVW